MDEDIKEQLLVLAESEYQLFTSKLLPGTDNILGVRLPKLRKLADKIAKEDWKSYLLKASDDTFEEVMLQGMIIEKLKLDIEEVLVCIEQFVPKISNWSLCDSFCAGLKITREYPQRMWDFIQSFLNDTREYHIRFGVVMLIYYYIDELHIDEALVVLEHIHHDAYYVKMAVAWAISMYYINMPERMMLYLKKNNLDSWTYNKALQKITE